MPKIFLSLRFIEIHWVKRDFEEKSSHENSRLDKSRFRFDKSYTRVNRAFVIYNFTVD